MNPFEMTKHLMSIPSLSGTEAQVGEFLASYLSALGYKVEKQPVPTGRFNVIAFAGDARVMLCSHIDTVSPQLPAGEDNEFLYGRGACDTKGIIAAMIDAGERLRRTGIDKFGYLFVVSEETDSSGAKTANTLNWNCDYVVVGEPTQNQLTRAQKGAFMASISVTGRAAHSGYPEYGISAIENLWKVLTDCQQADWGNDALLGNGSFNIGVFHGGERANIVPAAASASVMVRTISPRSEIEQKLRAIIGNRATMEVISASDPLVLHVVDGFPTTVVSFGSDAPHLTNLGKRLLIGPGSILDAHTATEKIRKSELLEGVDLYERLLRKLLS
jgi:acetylornithine deacetylase